MRPEPSAVRSCRGGLTARTGLSAEETRETALVIQENAYQSLLGAGRAR